MEVGEKLGVKLTPSDFDRCHRLVITCRKSAEKTLPSSSEVLKPSHQGSGNGSQIKAERH